MNVTFELVYNVYTVHCNTILHLDMFNSFIAWFDIGIYIVYLYNDRQMDGLINYLRFYSPIQQYFSHIRPMGG